LIHIARRLITAAGTGHALNAGGAARSGRSSNDGFLPNVQAFDAKARKANATGNFCAVFASSRSPLLFLSAGEASG
jgi:hypothetical protein